LCNKAQTEKLHVFQVFYILSITICKKTFFKSHVRHSPLMTCIFTALVCRSNLDCIRDNTKLFNDRSDYSWDSDRREIDIKIVKLMFKQRSLMYRCWWLNQWMDVIYSWWLVAMIWHVLIHFMIYLITGWTLRKPLRYGQIYK
jgi:hypothetical protein